MYDEEKDLPRHGGPPNNDPEDTLLRDEIFRGSNLEPKPHPRPSPPAPPDDDPGR